MKLYERFEFLSYLFRYEATYLEMKYHLKRAIKGKENEFIKIIGHYDRNIGKTCALARLSVKYNIPILIPTESLSKLYLINIPKHIPKYFKKKLPQVIVANEFSKGRRFDNILVEEGVSEKVLYSVFAPMVKNGMVGYKRLEF